MFPGRESHDATRCIQPDISLDGTQLELARMLLKAGELSEHSVAWLRALKCSMTHADFSAAT